MKWIGIAFELVSFIICFLILGFVLDGFWLQTGWVPGIGVAIGFVLWVFLLWKRFR